MYTDKVFIRSELQLENRSKDFLKVCDILKNLEIDYFLQGGVLLGAVRDQGFIPWDWDVEISILHEKLLPNFEKILTRLLLEGFKISKVLTDDGQIKVDFYGSELEEVTGFTIFTWSYCANGDYYHRRKLKIPGKYLKNFSLIKLCGIYHKTPNNVEKYLEYQYGDWQTPLKTDNKSLYLNKDFSGITIAVILKNFAKKYIKRYLG